MALACRPTQAFGLGLVRAALRASGCQSGWFVGTNWPKPLIGCQRAPKGRPDIAQGEAKRSPGWDGIAIMVLRVDKTDPRLSRLHSKTCHRNSCCARSTTQYHA